MRNHCITIDVQDDVVTSSGSTALSEFIDLIITARAKYNGTRVECVAENNDGDSIVSNTATLYIQGILSSVSDITVMNNISSITISWSAPFSLDVTDVDHDIWYSVLIYNMTNNTTVIRNITETHYTFTPDYPSPCHKYIFTIIPFNGAGQGQSSENITGYTIQKPPNVSYDEKVKIENDGEFYTVTINFSGDTESVCTYTLVLNKSSSFESYYQFENGTVIFKIPVDRVEPNTEYEVYFEISNAAGSNATHTTTFKTSACQDATAYINGKEIKITGDIMSGSSAKGCFFFFEGEKDHCVAVQRNNDVIYHQTDVDNTDLKKIIVYDIDENGLPNSLPALTVSPSNEPPDQHTVIATPTPVIVLTRAELNRSGSEVFVKCEFTDYEEATCVLVFQHDEEYLTVIEYTNTTTFPMNITVSTVFLFGKNGSLESDPILTLRAYEKYSMYDTGTTDDNTPGTPTERPSDSLAPVIAVMTTTIVIVLSLIILITILVVWFMRRRNKVHHKITQDEESSTSKNPVPKVSVIPATGGDDIETVPMENNKAYSTVVPMKRNECYASVLRPLPVNNETISDYEIIPI